MDKILIDSYVILDFFLDRKPHSEFSNQILSLCEEKKIEGFVTPVIISNVYYISRKLDNHENVISMLKSLIELIDVLTMDRESIRLALKSNFKDFEDALQNYTAEKSNKVKILLTRNVKDYKTSNLIVLSPEEYLNVRMAL